MNKILQLLNASSVEDFEVGLLLLDRLEKEDIIKFFEIHGEQDIANTVLKRPTMFSLKAGPFKQFTVYKSRHDFWYFSTKKYTLCINYNQSIKSYFEEAKEL